MPQIFRLFDLPQELISMIWSHLFDRVLNLCHLLDLRVVNRTFNEEILLLVFFRNGAKQQYHYYTSSFRNLSFAPSHRWNYVDHRFPPGACSTNCCTTPRTRFYALSRFALQAALQAAPHEETLLPKGYIKLIKNLSTAVSVLGDLLDQHEYVNFRLKLENIPKLRTSSHHPFFTNLASRAICHVALCWLSEPVFQSTRFLMNDRWLERERPAFWVVNAACLTGDVDLVKHIRKSVDKELFAKFGGNKPRFVAKMLLIPAVEGHLTLMRRFLNVAPQLPFHRLNRFSIFDRIVASGKTESVKLLLEVIPPGDRRVSQCKIALLQWRLLGMPPPQRLAMYELLSSVIEKYGSARLYYLFVVSLEAIANAAAGLGDLGILKHALNLRAKHMPENDSTRTRIVHLNSALRAATHGQVACLEYLLETMPFAKETFLDGAVISGCFSNACMNHQFRAYTILKQWWAAEQERRSKSGCHVGFVQLAGLAGSLPELQHMPDVMGGQVAYAGDVGAEALRHAILGLCVEEARCLLMNGAGMSFENGRSGDNLFIDVRWSKDSSQIAAFKAMQDLLTEYKTPINITWDYIQLHIGERLTDCDGKSYLINQQYAKSMTIAIRHTT